jgi:hypothetical protein
MVTLFIDDDGVVYEGAEAQRKEAAFFAEIDRQKAALTPRQRQARALYYRERLTAWRRITAKRTSHLHDWHEAGRLAGRVVQGQYRNGGRERSPRTRSPRRPRAHATRSSAASGDSPAAGPGEQSDDDPAAATRPLQFVNSPEFGAVNAPMLRLLETIRRSDRDPFDLTLVDRWPVLWRARALRCRILEAREGLS